MFHAHQLHVPGLKRFGRTLLIVSHWAPGQNAGVLYNGRSQQTIRIQKRYFDRVHKPSHIIRTI